MGKWCLLVVFLFSCVNSQNTQTAPKDPPWVDKGDHGATQPGDAKAPEKEVIQPAVKATIPTIPARVKVKPNRIRIVLGII